MACAVSLGVASQLGRVCVDPRHCSEVFFLDSEFIGLRSFTEKNLLNASSICRQWENILSLDVPLLIFICVFVVTSREGLLVDLPGSYLHVNGKMSDT